MVERGEDRLATQKVILRSLAGQRLPGRMHIQRASFGVQYQQYLFRRCPTPALSQIEAFVQPVANVVMLGQCGSGIRLGFPQPLLEIVQTYLSCDVLWLWIQPRSGLTKRFRTRRRIILAAPSAAVPIEDRTQRAEQLRELLGC